MSEEKHSFIIIKYQGITIYHCIYLPIELKTSLTSDNVVITGLTSNTSLTPSLTLDVRAWSHAKSGVIQMAMHLKRRLFNRENKHSFKTKHL